MPTNRKPQSYALGYYHGRATGNEQCPEHFTDKERHLYREGYGAGISDYCRENHPDEYDDAALIAQLDHPDLDPEEAAAVGRYLATRRTVSDTYTIGGRDYYRNKAGRCEDAPCCGCCTI